MKLKTKQKYPDRTVKPLVVFLGYTIPYGVLRLSGTKQHIYPKGKCLFLYGGVEHCSALVL